MNDRKLEERAKEFQKGLNVYDVKRKRDLGQIELRKKKRLEHISKKRALAGKIPQASTQESEEILVETASLDTELKAQYVELNTEDGLLVLKTLVEVVKGGDLKWKGKALVELKKILSVDHNPPLRCLFSFNITPTLVELLQTSTSSILFESAWILLNLASGPSEIVTGLVSCGCIPALTRLISNENDEIASLAIWALSNIAGDSLECRNLVIKEGAIEEVMGLLAQPKEREVRHLEEMMWFLSNLCRGLPPPPEYLIDQILPMIPFSLDHSSPSIISDSCWILSYLTEDKDSQTIDKVMSLGIERHLITFIGSKFPQVQAPALRAIGNILTGNDDQTQALLNLGLIDHLNNILHSQNREIRKEVLWCLSNVAAGSVDQVCLLSEHPCMPSVVSSLSDPDYEIKREALWTIANICHIRKKSLLETLLSLRVVEALVLILDQTDLALLLVALEAITRVFRMSVTFQDQDCETNDTLLLFENLDGTIKLENLQNHPNIKVYNKAVEIMGEFYGLIEITNENKEETGNFVPIGGFQFS